MLTFNLNMQDNYFDLQITYICRVYFDITEVAYAGYFAFILPVYEADT